MELQIATRASALAALACAALLACGSASKPHTGPVTLTVTWDGPVQGLPVAFHRPDGTVQEVTTTDASGRATAVIAEGALVTVGWRIVSSPDQWGLTTIAWLWPGDDLLLASRPTGPVPAAPALVPQTGAATVTFSSPVDGASSYRVDAACSSAAADAGYVDALSMQLYDSCGSAVDALALARAPGGALLAYAMATDVAVTGTSPDRTANVALGPWRTDFATLAIYATNAPASSQLFSWALEPKRLGRTFFGAANATDGGLSAGGSTSLTLTYAPGFFTSARMTETISFFSPLAIQADGASWVVEPDVVLATHAVDLSAALLPRLFGATWSSADGSFVASWQQEGPAPGVDGQVLSTDWSAQNGPHTWSVVVPPGTRSFAFPPLPPELAAFAPDSGAGPTGFRVIAYDDAGTVGYAAFKARRLGLLTDPSSGFDLALRGTETWTPQPVGSAAFKARRGAW
jgi:hypothetical protein